MLRRPAPLLFLLAPLLLPAAARAGTGWHTLQAPHCAVYSQLSEAETRRWAGEFEQFNAAARSVLVLDEAAIEPLTLVLFDQYSFGRYRPRGTDGEVRKDVGGFCTDVSEGVAIVLPQDPDRFNTRHALFHEATHWLLDASRTQVPLWLNEGFAEALATFAPGPEFGTLGAVDQFYIPFLDEEGWVPWEQVLRTTHFDPLYRGDPKLVHHFYAQSWLCVHRLLFFEPAHGIAALDRHTRARLRGANPQQAFQIAIERDPDLAEQQMRDYARRARITLRRIPCPPEAKVETPFLPADPLRLETLLGDLAIGSRRFEIATKHMAKVRALAPDSPTVFAQQVIYELRNDRKDAAYDAAKKAIAAGAADSWLLCFVGDRELATGRLDGLDDAGLRQRAEIFLHAIRENPRAASAYCHLARLVTRLQEPTEADAALLATGSEYFPDEAWPFVGLAAIRFRQNNLPEAKRLLGLALSRLEVAAREKPADSDDIATPITLGPKGAHIEALGAADKIPEAITEFEALLEIPLPKD